MRGGPPGQIDGLAAGVGDPDDHHLVLGADQRREPVPHRGRVVGDEDTDHRPGT